MHVTWQFVHSTYGVPYTKRVKLDSRSPLTYTPKKLTRVDRRSVRMSHALHCAAPKFRLRVEKKNIALASCREVSPYVAGPFFPRTYVLRTTIYDDDSPPPPSPPPPTDEEDQPARAMISAANHTLIVDC